MTKVRPRMKTSDIRTLNATDPKTNCERSDIFLFLFSWTGFCHRKVKRVCLGSMKQCSQFPVSVLGVPVYARRSAQASRTKKGGRTTAFCFCFSQTDFCHLGSGIEVCLGSMKQCSQFPVSVLGVPVYARRSAQASRTKKGGRTTAFCFCFSQTDFCPLLNTISERSLPGNHKAMPISPNSP